VVSWISGSKCRENVKASAASRNRTTPYRIDRTWVFTSGRSNPVGRSTISTPRMPWAPGPSVRRGSRRPPGQRAVTGPSRTHSIFTSACGNLSVEAASYTTFAYDGGQYVRRTGVELQGPALEQLVQELRRVPMR